MGSEENHNTHTHTQQINTDTHTMDQMLPSPGFSIPSIGTPLHHPEEDQQIIAANPFYSQQVGPPQNGLSSGNTPNPMSSLSMGSSSMLGGSTLGSSSFPTLPLPSKLNSYQPSYAASPQIQQPQTPVNMTPIYNSLTFIYNINFHFIAFFLTYSKV